jgi:hypothetical protein
VASAVCKEKDAQRMKISRTSRIAASVAALMSRSLVVQGRPGEQFGAGDGKGARAGRGAATPPL